MLDVEVKIGHVVAYDEETYVILGQNGRSRRNTTWRCMKIDLEGQCDGKAAPKDDEKKSEAENPKPAIKTEPEFITLCSSQFVRHVTEINGLRFFSHLDPRQIAEITGKPVGTIPCHF